MASCRVIREVWRRALAVWRLRRHGRARGPWRVSRLQGREDQQGARGAEVRAPSMSPMTGMVKRTNPPARSRSGACREAFRAGQVSLPFPPAHPSLGSALSGRPHLCARRMMMRDAGEPLVWRRVGPCATCVAQVTSCARFVRGDEGWRMMQARCGLSNSSLPGLAHTFPGGSATFLRALAL